MNTEDLDALEIAWRPQPGSFEASPAGRMAKRHGISSYDELAVRSVEDPEWFWAAAAEDVGLQWMKPYDTILDLSDGKEFPHFFKGGQLNWADCAVDRWIREGRGDELAVWWEGDDGKSVEMTYAELKTEVDRCAGAFRVYGIGEGDVIAMLLPMIPEAVITLIAGCKIGAIVAPMFSGYGPQPISGRLADSGAKLIVTCNAFLRRGKTVRVKEIADAATEGVDSITTMFVVARLDEEVPMLVGRDVAWDEALTKGTPVVDAPAFDVEMPCILMYTSGSTGRPKGCVHTHAGMTFKFAQESCHALGIDLGTRILWLTDMGWVMGTYLITAALTNGGTAVMFEGTPDFPEPDRLWDVTERSKTNVLGIAPTVVRALMAHGDSWPDRHELPDLKVIGTTGEPWNIEPWWWCFRHVGKNRAPIVNFSGGTECGASILAGSLFQPVKPASFSGRTLGMAADVVDTEGKSVRGEVGELVVNEPWPGMTKGLWDGKERYLDTYWSRYPGKWLQGDFAYVDKDGFWYILGRSDDTIMLAGKRVGPAEIESLLVDDEFVIEAAAVGIPDEVKGEALVCFVVLAHGAKADETVARLHDAIAANAGKTVRPKAIHIVDALPKTRNGKVMRRIAKAAYLGDVLGDTTSLENPEVLEGYQDLAGAH